MYFAMWHGGVNYSSPSVESDVTEYDSISDMLDECYDKYINWDGSTPCVDDSSGMTVWLSDPRGVIDPYPDFLIIRTDKGKWKRVGA